jgi:tetratricopeptide (TPR) repeat protein
VISRLDVSRGTEDVAADLVDVANLMEAALRSLVGTTALTGHALIREARQRQIINFDQANALAEFQAVRDRVQDTTYHPVEGDLNSARNAFLKIDAAVMSAENGPRIPGRDSASAPVQQTSVVESSEPIKVVGPPRRIPMWVMIAAGTVVVAAILLVILRPFGGASGGALQQGIDAYRGGQREAAVSHFTRASREPSTAVLAHVYLARMAREVGNFTLASQELQLALEGDPSNATALREMGANLLAQGNYELARRFYVRAVQADPTDKTSQGYLGCALMRLNRTAEATTFFNRAGPGPWTNCTPASMTQSQAGQVIPP